MTSRRGPAGDVTSAESPPLSTCVGNKVAQASASWLSGSSSQRQIMPRAARSFSQPRPISRLEGGHIGHCFDILSTSSMSATLHHHVCCCSVHSHATSDAGESSADTTASAGASAAPLGLWGTQKLAPGPCRSCKRPRQETSRERQRGQRSSPLLTPCSSTSRPPRGGRSESGACACIARVRQVREGGAGNGFFTSPRTAEVGSSLKKAFKAFPA